MNSDIFLFLSDEAFASVSTPNVVKYADISQTGIGMLDDNLLNYFVDHSIFLDPVSDGHNAYRKTRMSVDQQSGYEPLGRMMLHFDSEIFKDEGLFYNQNYDKPSYKTAVKQADLVSGFIVLPSDTEDYAVAKRNRNGMLFNIVDIIFHARNNDGSPKSQVDIDEILSSSSATTSQEYGQYVAESLALSEAKSLATTRLATQFTSLSEARFHWDSCKFDFMFSNEDNISITITFHVWLSSDAFKANYPYSTVVDCLYPCSPQWMMNPQLYANQTRAILISSNYKNEMLEQAVTKRDHSGVMLISSNYISEYSDELPMSFALLYKGSKPTTSAARTFLRSKLIDELDEDGHPWSKSEWKLRLPDLFVDGSYYLIPMYFSRVRLPDSNTAVEKSCVPYQKIFSKAKAILGGLGLDDATIMSSLDILQAPGHSLYIAGIALDPATQIPLHDLHSTYSSVDATHDSFDGMTAGDQDFAEKLSRAMAICLKLASDNSGQYSDAVIGTRQAKVFTAGDVHNNTNMEYIMLVYDKNDTIWS